MKAIASSLFTNMVILFFCYQLHASDGQDPNQLQWSTQAITESNGFIVQELAVSRHATLLGIHHLRQELADYKHELTGIIKSRQNMVQDSLVSEFIRAGLLSGSPKHYRLSRTQSELMEIELLLSDLEQDYQILSSPNPTDPSLLAINK